MSRYNSTFGAFSQHTLCSLTHFFSPRSSLINFMLKILKSHDSIIYSWLFSGLSYLFELSSSTCAQLGLLSAHCYSWLTVMADAALLQSSLVGHASYASPMDDWQRPSRVWGGTWGNADFWLRLNPMTLYKLFNYFYLCAFSSRLDCLIKS